ncbi:MAG: flagellar motor protein MotB [Fuerstiella sp.]
MPKKSCCPEPTGDVPAWFMTYSDVITLLMTFFILLLTFATSEPEFFAKVKVVAFGGGASSGAAGESERLVDKDSMIIRERPNSAALTTRGSEVPSAHENPARQSLSRGLQSLQNPDVLADASRVRIQTSVAMMQSADGEMTTQGVTQLRMLAEQLKRQPLVCQILVSDPEHAALCVKMAAIMTDPDGFGVIPGKVPGRVAVGIVDPTQVPPGQIVYRLSRTETE